MIAPEHAEPAIVVVDRGAQFRGTVWISDGLVHVVGRRIVNAAAVEPLLARSFPGVRTEIRWETAA